MTTQVSRLEVDWSPPDAYWLEAERENRPVSWPMAIAWTLVLLAAAGAIGTLFGLPAFIRASIAHGHLVDWVAGAASLVWLLAILKVPWDLYFQAYAVAIDLRHARERGIEVPEARVAYIARLRRRLAVVAVALHVVSAGLAAASAALTHGVIGYYFAGAYLVSGLMRPAAAAAVHLARLLRSIGREARYPYRDVVTLSARAADLDRRLEEMSELLDTMDRRMVEEKVARESDSRALRQSVSAVGREFEAAIARITDNQEVIRGVQAFVRLVVGAASPAAE